MQYDGKKPILLTNHAKEQCEERGATEAEILKAITEEGWKPANNNRLECKSSFLFSGFWNGSFYTNKEVRPIFVEELNEIVVITVYVYYN